jgi:hypothetical protein
MIDHLQGGAPPIRAAVETADENIRPVVEAVCAELGIATRKRRAAVEARILVAWRVGPRQPLDLVRAGLDA